jgi:dCMP deaminase
MSETTERPDWDNYFLNISKVVASRSSCHRNKVGAVIVKDKNILSSGYNGAPTHQRNCLEIRNCYRNENGIKSGTQLEMCRASGSHAESNAICLAAKNGMSVKDATIYIVGHNYICNMCKAMIANSGIKEFVLLSTDGSILQGLVAWEWFNHPIDLIKKEN